MSRHSPPASALRGSPFGAGGLQVPHKHGSEEVTSSPLKRKIRQAEAEEFAARSSTIVPAANARFRPYTHTLARRTLHGRMGAASPTVDSETEVTLKQRKHAWDGLFDMTQDELCNYLVSINADEEFIQNIVGNQINVLG